MRKFNLTWRLGVALAASGLFVAIPGLADDKKKPIDAKRLQFEPRRPSPVPQPAPQAQPKPQPAPQAVQPRPAPQVQPTPQPQPQPRPQPQAQPQPRATPQAEQPRSQPKIGIQQFLPSQPQPQRNQPGPQIRGSNDRGSSNQRFSNDGRRDNDHDHDHDHHHGLSSKQIILHGLIRSLASPQPRPGFYYGYGPTSVYRAPYYSSPTVIYTQPQAPVIVPDYQVNDPSVAPPATQPMFVPSADQLAEIPDAPQRDILLEAVNRFETDLNEMSTGESWKKHLQTSTIASLLTEKEGPPNAATRERLRRIAGSFDELAGDPKYRQVTDTWGFKTLRVGLKVYSAEPELKLRKQIAGATAAFDRALENVDTGESWKSHLRLSHLRSLSETTDANRAGRIEELTALADRFDGVATNESYTVIASKPGFGEARVMLKQYVEVIRSPGGAEEKDVAPPVSDVAPPAPKKEADAAPPKPE